MLDEQDPSPLTVRVRPSGAGWQWIRHAWSLFATQPLTWIVTLVVYMLVLVAASFVPLGDLATSLVGPVFLGGMLQGAHRQQLGGRMEITDLFSGFRDRLVPLLLLGVIQLLAAIVIGVVAVVIVVIAIGPAVLSDPSDLANVGLVQWVILATGVGVVVTAMMLAFWIATPLVAIAGCKPWEAVERSFDAGLRNWRALLVCGLAVIVLSILAAIPLGLGFIVLLPVLTIAGYTAFADVFWPDAPVGGGDGSGAGAGDGYRDDFGTPVPPPSHPDANLPPPAAGESIGEQR